MNPSTELSTSSPMHCHCFRLISPSIGRMRGCGWRSNSLGGAERSGMRWSFSVMLSVVTKEEPSQRPCNSRCEAWRDRVPDLPDHLTTNALEDVAVGERL